MRAGRLLATARAAALAPAGSVRAIVLAAAQRTTALLRVAARQTATLSTLGQRWMMAVVAMPVVPRVAERCAVVVRAAAERMGARRAALE